MFLATSIINLILKDKKMLNMVRVFFFPENTWKSWSKIGLLTQELFKSKISVTSVTFFKQLTPKQLSTFNYCFFVGITLNSKLDQVSKNKLI